MGDYCDVRIVPSEVKYSSSLNDCLSAVAAEGKYLSRTTAFSAGETKMFVSDCIRNDYPQYLVLDEADRVVGWCDVVTRDEYTDRLTGSLGVGLLPEYRDAGIGRMLIEHTIEAAAKRGYERIVLFVRESNARAVHLYEKLGFTEDSRDEEGLHLDGEDICVITMSMLIEPRVPEMGEKKGSRFNYLLFLLLVFAGVLIGSLLAIISVLR